MLRSSRTPAPGGGRPRARDARRPSALALPCLALAATLVVGLATPATLRAQGGGAAPAGGRGTFTLAGTVVDTSGLPVAGAEVRLVPRGTEVGVVPPRLPTTRAGATGATLSDAEGAFVIRGVPTDTVQIAVRRIGFRPASIEVAPAAPGMTATFQIALVPNPIQLRTVIVEGRAFDAQLWDVGFYKRERVGTGRYYGPEFLERFGGASLGTLLRETPRLMIDRRNNQEFAFGPLAGARCQLNVFIDGRFAREAMGRGALGLDQLVSRPDLYAMEVYPTANSVPSEFVRIGPATSALQEPARRIPLPPTPRGSATSTASRLLDEDAMEEDTNSDAACGALILWTRPFAMRRPDAAPAPPPP